MNEKILKKNKKTKQHEFKKENSRKRKTDFIKKKTNK